MKTLLILLVRAYQVVLSPMFSGCCRFEPSCSNYMIEALKVHGALKGTYLGIKRLLRCRPFGPHGYDPVPPPKKRSSAMIRINCFVATKEGRREEALEAAKALTEETLKQDGCIAYDIFESATRPGVMLFCETWKDQKSLDDHCASEPFKKYVAVLTETSEVKIESFEL